MLMVMKMIIHTVSKGESLYTIGKKYGVTIEQLIKANGNTVQPTLIIGQAVIIPTAEDKKQSKLINGYAYPNIDRGALISALGYISNISPFSYGIAEDGTLVNLVDTDIITISQSFSVMPILIVTTLTEEGIFNSSRAEQILQNESLADAVIENIALKLESNDYFGVDVDFEYIPAQNKTAYAEFIKKLKLKISALGYKTLVSLAPKTYAAQRGLLYEAHDYKALGEAADYVLVMTYEWGYTYGPPMAIAPINKVREVIEYAVSEIDAKKVLLGVPNYAYDWTLPYVQGSKAQSISNSFAIMNARSVGAEIVFDSQAMTPYYTYFKDEKEHIVWFEDARSVKARMELINEFGLAGFSVWNIMNFYQPLWTTANSYFLPKK